MSRVSARRTKSFCFGKRTQSHVGRAMAPCLRRDKLFGCLARFTDTGGAHTRGTQTVLAISPVSVALLGHATKPGESA